MNAELGHRQRMERCLSGQKPDRTPVALWRHFPVDDQDPASLAKSTVDFQSRFDFDIVKVTPASSFCIRDWGVEDKWNGSTEGTRDYTARRIHKPDDWHKLPALDPRKGNLKNQLTCLEYIFKELTPETPVIQTIFSPMSQAKNLVGAGELLVHMRSHPASLHEGLKVITETTLRFIESLLALPVAGIFFAVQHAQYRLLNDAEFEEFCKPYDLQILDAVKSLWLNMLHLHGEDVMFEAVTGYPVQIINWHDRHTWPDLAEGKKLFAGCVCGGLDRWDTMVTGNPKTIVDQARDSIKATGGARFILGTGCVLPIVAPRVNIEAARQAVNVV